MIRYLIPLMLLTASCFGPHRYQILAGAKMDCPAETIDVDEIGPNQFLADGCGKQESFERRCKRCPWKTEDEARADRASTRSVDVNVER